MRVKHRKDHNHGKRGWVGGNPRHRRARLRAMLDEGRREPPAERTMRGRGK